ncbi:hypothetical protein [Sedimentitalea todarodis]|uniref:Mobilization protein n=1 Tax=Sedimentitalea todarodis TaxID=1631240 RepID=A0ABU3VLS9_9RHOB|nr:hypothetical protein [Sedimentitalea todarodis]MDU9007137.1 hypothetical protein [Sedimentitalea todarodis]
MPDPNLEKLQRQYEQAKARLQSARARKAAKDRKLDARRKIILGGALIEKASRDREVTRVLMSLVAGLSRVQDRKAFDGWSPPAPSTHPDAEAKVSGSGGGADSGGSGSSPEEGAGLDRNASVTDTDAASETGTQGTEAKGDTDPGANVQMERRP